MLIAPPGRCYPPATAMPTSASWCARARPLRAAAGQAPRSTTSVASSGPPPARGRARPGRRRAHAHELLAQLPHHAVHQVGAAVHPLGQLEGGVVPPVQGQDVQHHPVAARMAPDQLVQTHQPSHVPLLAHRALQEQLEDEASAVRSAGDGASPASRPVRHRLRRRPGVGPPRSARRRRGATGSPGPPERRSGVAPGAASGPGAPDGLDEAAGFGLDGAQGVGRLRRTRPCGPRPPARPPGRRPAARTPRPTRRAAWAGRRGCPLCPRTRTMASSWISSRWFWKVRGKTITSMLPARSSSSTAAIRSPLRVGMIAHGGDAPAEGDRLPGHVFGHVGGRAGDGAAHAPWPPRRGGARRCTARPSPSPR